MEMAVDTTPIEARSATDQAPRPSKGGSNKLRLLTLEHLDGRTRAAHRARELIAAMEQDLGGPTNLSTGERQLIQRAACLGAFVESCETRWLGGAVVELAEYLAAINVQRRILATLGLRRRPKELDALSLSEYLATKAAAGETKVDATGEHFISREFCEDVE
jgi:hypothetical protein